jgi:hypothetical protein
MTVVTRLPRSGGCHSGVLAGQRRNTIMKACRGGRPAGGRGTVSVPRGRAWLKFLVASARLRADSACIFLFSLYIPFGTKGRARADVRPCTGRRDGPNLPLSRRGIRSRTRMTPRGEEDTDGSRHQRHRRL